MKALNRRTLFKYSTFGIGVLFAFKKIQFELTKDNQFENKMRLIFPHYNSESGDKGLGVKIVSEN